MENHVFLPIITAFCLPEQEKIELFRDTDGFSMPFQASLKSAKAQDQAPALKRVTQIYKATIISRRRTSPVKSKPKVLQVINHTPTFTHKHNF